MGSGSFDPGAYRSFAASTAGKSTAGIFTARGLDATLNPYGVRIRESRDSEDSPESTPIIVAIDVTGSMGIIADTLARKGLGTLFTEILNDKPVPDPHVMFMAVGDANCDSAPLQVSQFEADNRVVEQLTKIFLEGGGGGNRFESYNLPWYFAAQHTEHDNFIKRGKRGYLFTVGDEEAPRDLTKDQIIRFIGDTPERDVDTAEILRAAQRTYDVFHIIIKEGDYASRAYDEVRRSWTALLGQRVIPLADHAKLSETIVSAIKIAEGNDPRTAASKYGATVLDAVANLPAGRRPVAMLGN